MAKTLCRECRKGDHTRCQQTAAIVHGPWGGFTVTCQCECHVMQSAEPPASVMQSAPGPDEHGYWTRTEAGGLHYHAYDPATE